MGLCVSKNSTSVYGGDSSSAASTSPMPQGASAGPTQSTRSSVLGGLSLRSTAARTSPSHWSSIRTSLRVSDPRDSRLTRAIHVLGDLYRSSPTFRAVAEKVRDEGGVDIREGNVNVASTDLTNRAILLSPQTLSNAGSGDGPSLVSALVFEMNNLARSSKQRPCTALPNTAHSMLAAMRESSSASNTTPACRAPRSLRKRVAHYAPMERAITLTAGFFRSILRAELWNRCTVRLRIRLHISTRFNTQPLTKASSSDSTITRDRLQIQGRNHRKLVHRDLSFEKVTKALAKIAQARHAVLLAPTDI